MSSGGSARGQRPSSGGEAGRDHGGGGGAPVVKRRARGLQKRATTTLKRHKTSNPSLINVDKYDIDYGLRKMEVTRGGKKSVSLECKFCAVFEGRESK